jgi:hypothetical protein
MGFDVKATADRVIAAIDAIPTPTTAQLADGAQNAAQSAQSAANQVGTAIAAHPGSFVSYAFAAIVLMSVAGLIWRIRIRLGRALEETMFSNWRLALLGTTGVVLTMASGYTTWDGMRNFTGEGVLSAMVTFGIQGVMLIVAWLIGESFAIGMNQHSARARERGSFGLDPMVANIIGAVAGIGLFIALVVWLNSGNGQTDTKQVATAVSTLTKLGNNLVLIVAALLSIALVTLYAASDLVRPYIQSVRVIIKNSVLWVMFLACAGTSVFFSFDSLFTAIFPQSERVRAAELRAQNQVSGILADIEEKITQTRLDEAQNLFQAQGWQAYEAQLAKLADQSRASASDIEKYFNDQIEERNRAIKQQQERMTTAQGGQAGLAGRKTSLGDELNRLKGDRPTLATEFAQKKADLDAKNKDVDVKRVEALAEAGGVEGTGKEGKGPMYRQRLDEQAKLQAAVKIAEERFNDAKKRLATVETRITQIEREQSSLDGDLAKLKGEAETAEQRIKLTQEQLPSDAGARVDPSRITPAFETAKAEFRQEPTIERLAKVQQLCTQIYTAMTTATPATKKQVAGIDCDPKQAAEAASIVFALNAGTDVFTKSCKGGEKLSQLTSADALFGFSRKCLSDSGLPSKETDQLRTKINFIELNRDDKAHRFVVTWNAFQDGNRLAYLALGIAIAIDSLVFMSGLFGANAVRSPLSDVPSHKARTAQQLESTINAALGKLPYDTAVLVLNAMRPITNTDGFSATVSLDGMDKPSADRIRVVLTAGADIHAVEGISQNPERYRVRSELREYLSSVCDRHLKTDKSLAQRARLEQVVAVALKPHIQEHADIVIGHLDPIKPVDGFTSTVSLANITDAYEARVIRRVMNAGSTLSAVAPDKSETGRFYVRPDLYEALLMLSAHTPRSASFYGDRDRFFAELDAPRTRGIANGGALDANVPLIQPPQSPQARLDPPTPAQTRSSSNDLQASQAAFPQEPAAPASLNGDQQRLREFVGSLVGSLGINPNQFFAMSGSAFGAAAAASEEFARVRRSNHLLDNELTQRDEEARVAMDNAFYGLESGMEAGDGIGRQLLKDAFQDIDHNWSVLMLLPGGPYEKVLLELVQALEPEAAEGTLSQKETALLIAAKDLRSALHANPRQSESDWQRVDQTLQHALVRQASMPNVGQVNKPTLQ